MANYLRVAENFKPKLEVLSCLNTTLVKMRRGSFAGKLTESQKSFAH